MKLIFALGNTGKEYESTRHNVGFTALDMLAAAQGDSFQEKSRFKAFIADMVIGGEKVLVAKPSTFYNNVGESYRLIVDYYKIEPDDILVIHDELALPFGTIRLRVGGTDAGNNGIKSINQHGGNSSFRLRTGIANETRSLIGDTDFVLGKFSLNEQKILDKDIYPLLLDSLRAFSSGSATTTTVVVVDQKENSKTSD